MWSAGLVLAELCGTDFHLAHVASREEQEGDRALATFAKHGKLLCRQLGSPPAASSLESMPLFSASGLDAKVAGKPWPASLRSAVGVPGEDLLGQCLVWEPRARTTVARAFRSPYFRPESLDMGGVLGVVAGEGDITNWAGHRHRWNVRVGHMEPLLLQWLRADPALQPGNEQFQALGVTFTGEDKRWLTEEGRKFKLSGYLGQKCFSRQMCTSDLSQALPLPRVQAWFEAWRWVNKDDRSQAAGSRFHSRKRRSQQPRRPQPRSSPACLRPASGHSSKSGKRSQQLERQTQPATTNGRTSSSSLCALLSALRGRMTQPTST